MKNLTTANEVTLSIIFLGSSWFLINSLRPGRGPQERQEQRTEGLTGLLGLLSGGLDLCWDLGLLRYSSAAVAVYFARHLLRGIVVTMLAAIVLPKSTKLLLSVSVTLFVVFNLFVIAHYGLRHLGSNRYFLLANGFFIGVSLPFVWLQGQRRTRSERVDGIAVISGSVGSEKEP
jgi:hypothetical protein